MIPFQLGTLVALVRRFTPAYDGWASVRKRTVWLKFLSSCLICAQAQRHRFPGETAELARLISGHFPTLSASVFATFYGEIATLIRCLLNLAPGNAAAAAFLGTIAPAEVAYALFVVQAIQVRRTLPLAELSELLRAERPSQVAAALKSLHFLVQTGRGAGVARLIPAFATALPAYPACFKCGKLAAGLFTAILNAEVARELDADAYARFTDAFLRPVNAPTFGDALAVASLLVRRIRGVFSILVSAGFPSFELVCAIDSAYHARLGDLRAREAELFRVEAFECFLIYFQRFPGLDTARLLYRMRGNMDVASCFFGRLPQETERFLPLFAFLKKEMCDRAPLVIKATRYRPASRDRAMKGIEGGDDLTAIFAGAETDEVEAIGAEAIALLNSTHSV
jgi:hypothetical protein